MPFIDVRLLWPSCPAAILWIHFELGRRPHQPAPGARWFAERQCGSQEQPSRSVCPFTQGTVLSDTHIATYLLESYRLTDYKVHGPVPFSLKTGQPSGSLLQLYKQHRCDCAAFITACNPYSRKLAPAVNAQRQLDLMADLTSRSLIIVEGLGIGQDPDWPGEANCLIFGLALEASRVLGHKFQQNAIVWCGPDAKPELVLLR